MTIVERMLKRPVAVAMFVLLLVFLGALSYFTRPVDLLPQISVPSLAVFTYYPNANPEKIGQTVTVPLEAVLGTVTGLKDIHSVSSNDESLIVLEFDWGVNIDYKIPEIREKIRTVKLPESAYSPSVQRWDASSMPVFRFDLSGPQSAHELRRMAKESIVPRIERLPGVGTVKIYGGADPSVRVAVSTRKLAGYGIPIGNVLAAIAKQNVRVQVGTLTRSGKTVPLTLDGRFSSPADIGWTVIGSGRGGAVYLKDAAEVSEVFEEQKEFARLDGRESVAVAVCKTRGGNTLEMIGRIKDVLRGGQGLPPEVKIVASRDDSQFITEAQSLVTDGLFLGSLCTMLVLFIFLRDWRSTAVVCLTIPVCMIACFIPMWYFGIGRNILSLAGLALATGMVVDASTVMVDNMLRHRGYGRSLYDACISGAAEVKSSIMASALSTIVVFLPLLCIKGFVGELFRDLSLTVAGAMACSLVVVFTMTPVLYFKFSRDDDRMSSRSTEPPPPGAPLSRAWALLDRIGAAAGAFVERAVRWQITSIRRQVLVCSAVFLVCFGALAFTPSTGFIPTKYVSELRIGIKNPPGQNIEVSRELVRRVEGLLAVKSRIRTFSSSISADSSEVYVKLKPGGGRSGADRLVKELRGEFAGIPSLEAIISKVDKVSSAVGLGKLMEFKVSGADGAEVRSNAALIHGILSRTGGVVNLGMDEEAGPEGLRLDVERERAQGLGLNSAVISRMVATVLYGATATRYERGQEDVKVTGTDDERRNIADIMIVPQYGDRQRGRAGAVRLGAVASLGKEKTLKKIERFDKRQVVTISADVASGHSLGSVLKELRGEISGSAPRAAGNYSIRGVANCLVESVSDIRYALLISLVLVYMIMAAQFESLLYPLVIMTTVPLTSIGIIGGLRLANEDLSIPALLGVVMLLGILVNSGIVIVSFINMERSRGADITEAVFTALRSRLKPIAITTLTTVLGMLPLALGVGAGAELYQGMAVVVIGGLLTSTCLSLLIVPSVYILFEEAASYLNLLRMRFMSYRLRT
ncbi:MAG TPA: hypothetical protein DCS63_02465 [Elusimicrobia bacterium]|nr:hypothetical protein [Elusimicrobiota bacterium]